MCIRDRGCFGLFALPSGFDPVFAGFKAIWCLLAFGMGIYNFLVAAGKVRMGGYEITDDEPDDRRAAPRSDAEARLTELRSLYDRGLITEEEYEAKRCDKMCIRDRAMLESLDRVSVVISEKLKSPVRCIFEQDRVLLLSLIHI